MYDQFFHWNPDPFIFVLPGLNRPVGWYGLCFAFGFYISFKVVSLVFYDQLKQWGVFHVDFVEDWNKCLDSLKNNYIKDEDNDFWSIFSSSTISKIKKYKSGDKISDKVKSEIASSFESYINSADKKSIKKKFEVIEKMIGPEKLVRQFALKFFDKNLTLSILGTVVGARLFHVFFYGWHYYSKNLLEIPMVWKGGLASHGGVLGVIVICIIIAKRANHYLPNYTFLDVMNPISVGIGFAFSFIRLGNFFNQEILGHQTSVPWAIVFGSPAAGHEIVPRHPVQLYESMAYMLCFIFLNILWKKYGNRFGKGFYFSIILLTAWPLRFMLESFKMVQSDMIDESSLFTMGQWLTFPFVIWGGVILYQCLKTKQIHE